MDHLAELSSQESNMCNNINEMVTYFSLTLQQAAHFNKAHNSARLSQKGVNVRKIVNEYDQEIPQSQTADNPVAP